MSEIGGTALGDLAKEYAHKFVVQEGVTNGWQWIAATGEFWLQHSKKIAHYRVLEKVDSYFYFNMIPKIANY